MMNGPEYLEKNHIHKVINTLREAGATPRIFDTWQKQVLCHAAADIIEALLRGECITDDDYRRNDVVQ